jgi:hypothetical protein
MNVITLLSAKEARFQDLHLRNFDISVQEGILTFKAELLKYDISIDTITEPDVIARYHEREIRHRNKYFLFGKEVPYIPARTTILRKETEPFTLVTNSWAFVCTNKDVNINLTTEYRI